VLRPRLKAAARRARVRPRVERVCLSRLTGPPEPLVVEVPDLEVREVTPEDIELIDQVAELGFYLDDPVEIASRLRGGERCFGAVRDDRVVGSCWTATGSYSDWYLARTLVLGENEHYCFGFIVEPGMRGQGILPRLLYEVTSQLSSEVPGARFFALIRSTNTASLRTVSKLGFCTQGELLLFTAPFGIRIQWLRGDTGLIPHNRRLRVDVRVR
jgi:RimJ/RimL family protein N-acetyltransferase